MTGSHRKPNDTGIMHNQELHYLHGLDELLADPESLTMARVAEYLATVRVATANWFGRTGRAERSAWIDRDGTGLRDECQQDGSYEESVFQHGANLRGEYRKSR